LRVLNFSFTTSLRGWLVFNTLSSLNLSLEVALMSYAFFVATSKAPAADDLLSRINSSDLMVVNQNIVSQWPRATLLLCHRERSTRGVQLSYANGEVEVKTSSFSSPEDYELALKLTVAAAEATGSQPRGEYSRPVTSEELRARHNTDWIKGSHVSALRTTRLLVQERGPMGMPGPFRAFYIGPRIFEQLGHTDDAAAIEGVLNLMRRVQWIQTEGYNTAKEFTIGGTKQRLAMWFPTRRMFLPKVQWICVAEAEPSIIMPFERLSEVVGQSLTLIDEYQPLIEPTSPQELPNLVARARRFHSSPTKAD
jgi:hypothetical protein